jgi:hypothetical protein
MCTISSIPILSKDGLAGKLELLLSANVTRLE